ncbi:MAG: hypothetical protein R3281_01020 [Balneolaceae bacterium]|nr:hypothetical protein [Balneolaceae bacterium]
MMTTRSLLLLAPPLLLLLVGSSINESLQDTAALRAETQNPHKNLFQTADACMSCHNGIVTPSGEDISFGIDWRSSMMANSARDPYWQAAVRREITDHPGSQAHIEQECSTCHMPMAHYESVYNNEQAGVFANLPVNWAVSRSNILASDGVSCTTCHQITEEKLGTRESFVGRFAIDTISAMGFRQIFGPYPVDQGLSGIMHSSTGFSQKQSKHIQRSELCATCHTLITESLGPDGEVIGELPEQVPYLEWKHSSFVNSQSCQSCHMPVVGEPVAISSVLGEPREEVSRHSFRGGNFFMLRMLNRYRDELGVQALPNEMNSAVERTLDHLQNKTARITIDDIEIRDNQLRADVSVQNLAGHKLPTAYPSRRVWIRFTVKDRSGHVLFESGELKPDGAIFGNDNDSNPRHYEPHYDEIHSSDQIQIYETIMVGPDDQVTTGLLTAVRFIKDNRILPDGFDKTTAGEDIAVQGRAYRDVTFTGGRDRVSYRVPLENVEQPLQVTASLWYQPIGYRWAQNLEPYESMETERFVTYFNNMSDQSATMLVETKRTIE